MMAWANYQRRQLPWMRDVVVGSVLSGDSGAWRIVRRVYRFKNGDLAGVVFAIKRCSWTHRCYTHVGYNDLIKRGFSMVPVKPRKLRSRLDRKIHTAIHERCTSKSMTCCDVEGVQ